MEASPIDSVDVDPLALFGLDKVYCMILYIRHTEHNVTWLHLVYGVLLT